MERSICLGGRAGVVTFVTFVDDVDDVDDVTAARSPSCFRQREVCRTGEGGGNTGPRAA